MATSETVNNMQRRCRRMSCLPKSHTLWSCVVLCVLCGPLMFTTHSRQSFGSLVSAAGEECEVCIANLEKVDALLDSDEKTSKESIIEAIDKHCGDLQNEKPNPALGPKDLKMCYYLLPIKRAVAQPFSTRKPKDRVCKDLKKQNPEICEVKYPVKVATAESEEELVAKLKKMKIKDLRRILNDRGVDGAKIGNFVEKAEYINEVLATQHLEL